MPVYYTTDAELKSVADAIRAKGGTSENLEYPSDFISAIGNISTTPDKASFTITNNTSGSIFTSVPAIDTNPEHEVYGKLYLANITVTKNSAKTYPFPYLSTSAARDQTNQILIRHPNTSGTVAVSTDTQGITVSIVGTYTGSNATYVIVSIAGNLNHSSFNLIVSTAS